MQYLSTRGGMPARRFSDILLGGLAPDGGLVMPAEFPQIDAATLASWRGLSYPALAFELLRRYCDDIPAEDLQRLLADTYTAEVFGSEDITPVSCLDVGSGQAGPLYLLHLSNGPTLAFKDMAMQLLGGLFEYTLLKQDRWLNIVGATSGDTGSAAEYAMRGRQRVRVFMLSPAGRMSAFQRAQMYSLLDDNVFNIAIDGVFDECQDLVKAISGDLGYKERHAIGTVNSINWARVVAQVVYYFRGYLLATASQPLGADGLPRKVSFTVPTGNFGNVLAGYIARRMGLPVSRLVVATNENDVLDEFFRTGRYRVRGGRETYATSSPSMDISKASNFERFIYDLLDGDAGRVLELWQRLDRTGEFDLSGTPEFARVAELGFRSGSSSHADRMATIRHWYRTKGVIVDTHTADGLKVAAGQREPDVPMICLETALPAKFADSIQEAIGRQPDPRPGLRHLEERAQRYTWMPVDLAMLKSYIAART
ncbi:MAG: threonine synthase [Lautropia sp.]|nr:threonine synthase [Lautropia sp.]